jgi:hypothetical protein
VVLLGQPVLPDVGRLEDVAVGVDDAVVGHARLPCAALGSGERRSG